MLCIIVFSGTHAGAHVCACAYMHCMCKCTHTDMYMCMCSYLFDQLILGTWLLGTLIVKIALTVNCMEKVAYFSTSKVNL